MPASLLSTELVAAAVVVLLAALGAVLLHEDRVGLALAGLAPGVAVKLLVSVDHVTAGEAHGSSVLHGGPGSTRG